MRRPTAETAAIVKRVAAALRPDARWLWADFDIPASGFSRLRARLWLSLLYSFFRRTTGIEARLLPDAVGCLERSGFVRCESTAFRSGLILSEVWRRVV